jgi:hypothetical protein
MIEAVRCTAEQIRVELARLADEDELNHGLGPTALAYHRAAQQAWEWILGEAPSPIFGYQHVSDKTFDDELRFVYRVIEEDDPDRQAELYEELRGKGFTPDYLLGVYRALRWLRTGPASPYAHLVHPIPWR